MQDALVHDAQSLFDAAIGAKRTVGFAESCTAGLCSASVASIPGSSEILAGGIVSYMCSVKERVLGVDAAILGDPSLGPVSRECAEQMAVGARRLLGCDCAVSVTGLAGPGGAEPGKPVGTVWFACATDGQTMSKVEHLSGTRDEIRAQAACIALRLAREGLMEK